MEKKNIETKQERDRRTRREVFYALGLLTKLGVSIVVIAASFILVGIYLDRYFGTNYIFVLIGLILSIVVSIYNIYWLLEPVIGSEKRKNFLKRKK